jgi:hypothetical protein
MQRAMNLTRLPSARAGRPLAMRTSRALWLKHAVRAVLVILLIVLVALGAMIAIVLSGPTEFGLVRARVAATLQKSLGGDYEVGVGRTVIDVDPVLGLVIQADDISIKDGRKAVVATVPSARLAIDPTALYKFRVEVHTIELTGASVSFVRAADGEVYLGNASTAHHMKRKRARQTEAAAPAPMREGESVATPVAAGEAAKNDGGFPDLLAALQILDRGVEPPINTAVQGGFRRFSLVDGDIDVWDAERQQQRRFLSSDLVVTVDPLTSALSANFTTSGYGGRWTATIEREVETATGDRTMSAVFSQLTVADILPGLGESSRGISADIPLYGRATIRFTKDGTLQAANVRLDVGAGVVQFAEGRESILLDEATIKLRWDVARKAIVVDPSTLFFGDTRFVVVGTIQPLGDSADRRFKYDLESRGAILAPRDSNEAPLVAQRIGLSGVADFPGKLLTFDDAMIVTQDGTVAAAGSFGFEGATPSFAAAATFSPMPASTLKQIWPAFIAPGPRRWVLQHVTDGRLVAGRLEAAIPPGLLWNPKRPRIPDEALKLDFRFEDASFTTFGKLPPIEGASGNAVLQGSTFGVDVEGAKIHTPSGETVDVNAGAFAIANTAPRYPQGNIDVQLAGSAKALGELADVDPFNALSKRNLTPADLSGKGRASVSIRLPLRPNMAPADVDYRISIDATDLASKAPIDGRKFSDADVNITVTPDAATIKGRAKIDGAVADIDMVQRAGGDGAAAAGQRQIRLTLDDAARKRFGLALDEVLAGTIGLQVSNLEGKGQHYELDLKNARLMLPGVGWSKGIGVPATMAFDVKPRDGGFSVEGLTLSGAGFGFKGSAKLDSGYGLVSANIDEFALHKGDSLSLTMTRNEGAYAIVAKGSAFDLRGFLANMRQPGERSANSPDISIDAKIAKLTGFNQQVMSGATLTMRQAGGAISKLMFSGGIGSSTFSIDYQSAPKDASLLVQSADAGSVLSFLDVYTRFQGGTMRIVGRRMGGANEPLAGTFEIADFVVVNEPAMQRVVQTTSSDPHAAPTGFNPSQVHFDRMVAKYAKTDQVISIRDALLRGAAVGAVFSGRVDTKSSKLSITGTYLPAYQLNNMFSKLPIIGLALGGGFSEGLIGVTFKIDGTMADPRLFVNPLSAVAPGIFRKIFEFQ